MSNPPIARQGNDCCDPDFSTLDRAQGTGYGYVSKPKWTALLQNTVAPRRRHPFLRRSALKSGGRARSHALHHHFASSYWAKVGTANWEDGLVVTIRGQIPCQLPAVKVLLAPRGCCCCSHLCQSQGPRLLLSSASPCPAPCSLGASDDISPIIYKASLSVHCCTTLHQHAYASCQAHDCTQKGPDAVPGRISYQMFSPFT